MIKTKTLAIAALVGMAPSIAFAAVTPFGEIGPELIGIAIAGAAGAIIAAQGLGGRKTPDPRPVPVRDDRNKK